MHRRDKTATNMYDIQTNKQKAMQHTQTLGTRVFNGETSVESAFAAWDTELREERVGMRNNLVTSRAAASSRVGRRCDSRDDSRESRSDVLRNFVEAGEALSAHSIAGLVTSTGNTHEAKGIPLGSSTTATVSIPNVMAAKGTGLAGLDNKTRIGLISSDLVHGQQSHERDEHEKNDSAGHCYMRSSKCCKDSFVISMKGE